MPVPDCLLQMTACRGVRIGIGHEPYVRRIELRQTVEKSRRNLPPGQPFGQRGPVRLTAVAVFGRYLPDPLVYHTHIKNDRDA